MFGGGNGGGTRRKSRTQQQNQHQQARSMARNDRLHTVLQHQRVAEVYAAALPAP
jgi:hypothetical protein